jgi:hypothetical protein
MIKSVIPVITNVIKSDKDGIKKCSKYVPKRQKKKKNIKKYSKYLMNK